MGLIKMMEKNKKKVQEIKMETQVTCLNLLSSLDIYYMPRYCMGI